MLSSKTAFAQLPQDLEVELCEFKDRIDEQNPTGGNFQLNPIPEAVKRMIQKDARVLNRLKEGYQPLA